MKKPELVSTSLRTTGRGDENVPLCPYCSAASLTLVRSGGSTRGVGGGEIEYLCSGCGQSPVLARPRTANLWRWQE